MRLKASKTLMKDFGSRSKMMPLYKWPNLREGEGERRRRVGPATLIEERALILSVVSISFNRISTLIRHIRDCSRLSQYDTLFITLYWAANIGTFDSFSIVLGFKYFSYQMTPKFKMATVLLWKRDSAHFVRTMRLILSVCSCVFDFDDKNPSLVCKNKHFSDFFPRAQRLMKPIRDIFST